MNQLSKNKIIDSLLRFFVFVLIIVLAIFSQNKANAYQTSKIHIACHKYQHEVRNAMRREFGFNQKFNHQLMMALIYQESRCNPMAKSYVGARGLGQIMPRTSEWLEKMDANLRGLSVRPYSPKLQIRAVARYLKWLHDLIKDAATIDDLIAFTLSAYNGGQYYTYRRNKGDRLLTKKNGKDPDVWKGNVELFSTRRESLKKENRNYVDMIMNKWLPMYRGY